jgi:hypothetical protein
MADVGRLLYICHVCDTREQSYNGNPKKENHENKAKNCFKERDCVSTEGLSERVDAEQDKRNWNDQKYSSMVEEDLRKKGKFSTLIELVTIDASTDP